MVFFGRLQPWRPLLRWGAGLVVSGLLSLPPAQARDSAMALAQLPAEARTVHQQIHAGGPFAFSNDGIVFANREQLLPAQPRGFYREYTVAAPGSRSRGARRIVCGGAKATELHSCYYTADHYNSFHRITP